MFNSFAIAALAAQQASALSSAGWRDQSIYQLVTDRFARTDASTTANCDWGNYCGGTFQGLINKLDYIQGMGHTAIWISPVIAQLSNMTAYGLPYHGYWPQDSYSINPKFGTAADLKALSAALHKRGMYLMVDVVPNHSAYNGAPSTIDYTQFNPFNKASYYHTPYCAINYSNITSVTQCWMGDTTVSLPDIKTESATVQSMWNSWVTQFVANYSIDGLRIDSAMQMNKQFFPTFVSSAGVYAMGEVLNGGPDFLCDYQIYMPGMTNYAYYYWVKNAFTSTSASMATLKNNIGWLNVTCNDTTLLGNFIENHDNPRFASFTNDSSLIQNAIAFNMMSDGIPITYYGQEQGFSGVSDPYNREPLWPSGYDTTTTLYKFIGKINAMRNYIISLDSTYTSSKAQTTYSDADTLVTLKSGSGSKVISVFTNDGATGKLRVVTVSNSKTSFPANTGFTDVVACKEYTTDANGDLAITITNGMPMVLFHTNGLGGGICDSVSSTTSSSAAKSTVATTSSTSSTTLVKTTSTTSSTTPTKSTTSSSVRTTTSTTSSTSITPTPSSTTSSTTSSTIKTGSTFSATSSTIKASSTTISTPTSTLTPTTSSSTSSATSSTSSSIKTTSATSTSVTPAAIPSSSTSSSIAPVVTSSTSSSTTSSSSSSIISTASPSTSPVTCPASNGTQVVSNGKLFLIECGIDHAAGDLTSVTVKNLTLCVDACAANSACVDVSLSGVACYLKSKLGAPVYNNVYGAKLLGDAPVSTSSSAAAVRVATSATSNTSSSALTTSTPLTTSIATTSTSSKTSSTMTSSTAFCTPSPSTYISFSINATTTWGQGVYLTGSNSELNSWNTSYALTMDSSNYPIWVVNQTFDAGEYVEYKFIKANNGLVSWEGGDNRNLTVPTVSSCDKSGVVTVNAVWQS